MSSHGSPAVLGETAGPSEPAPRARAHAAQPPAAGPWWMRAAPSLVMLVVALIGITSSSFWRDEAATLSAVRRPFGQLIHMLGHVDAVHGAYYMLAFVVSRLFGEGELALRLPSALAMAVAAYFVAAAGRRLVSPAAGLAAGLTFAIIPQVSFYAQDARSYAFVVMMATIASYLLIRALQAGEEPARARGAGGAARGASSAGTRRGAGRRRRWWVGYGVSLALLGILNIFALLLIPAHAVAILFRCWRPPAGYTRRGLALRWAGCAVFGIALSSPLLYFAYREKGQVSWLKVPDGLDGVNQLVGPMPMLFAAVAVILAGLALSALGGWARLRANWPAGLDQLALPWLVLPPALLIAASHATPVYTFRYILFCTPAVALLIGAGAAAVAAVIRPRLAGAVAGAACLLLVAGLGLGAQASVRKASGHKDNLRGFDKIVARVTRPGQAVYYPNPNAESFPAAYRYGLDQLRNIQLSAGPIASGTLGGTNAPAAVVRQRLAHVKTLWVVNINTNASGVALIYGLHFRLVTTYRCSDLWLREYARTAPVR